MTETSSPTITIAGAGLVGSLLALRLAKEGYTVQVLEKRGDPRYTRQAENRSINLALSHRGLKALRAAGPALEAQVLAEALPMFGRQMHNEEGGLSFQPYGKEGECIYSVSRARLNAILISAAEKEGVRFLFGYAIEEADPFSQKLQVVYEGKKITLFTPVLLAADGVFSKVRKGLEKSGLCHSQTEFISHGYKELDIKPGLGRLDALHIWPRGEYMFIALPNADESYTGTLFLPLKDSPYSFEQLSDSNALHAFFASHFPDVLPHIPDLDAQYFDHPNAGLTNVFTDTWQARSWLLIGDAAHGIVPFYGQGMNAGFEDVRLLMEMLKNKSFKWEEVFSDFAAGRKKDADAIARLAMDNFIEMRDLVADEKFLLQKKIEAALHLALPELWKTLYSEVTFSDTPYSEALVRGKRNQHIMSKLMQETAVLNGTWEQEENWKAMVEKVKRKLSAESESGERI